jgi:3-methyladenine DNA glycosylase AlkD
VKLPAPTPKLRELRKRLRRFASAQDAQFLQHFFKTGPSEYGEGDQFLGIRVPVVRRLVREFRGLSMADTCELLHSPIHEERLLALLMLVDAYDRGTESERAAIFRLYLDNTAYINNWDLVDGSAPGIVGRHLETRPRKVLFELARSPDVWKRRIAVLAAFRFIRRNEFAEILRLAEMLLQDRHDLIHKAVGWMLREAGKRDVTILRGFLEQYAARMPRTMLRYSIEKLPVTERRRWLAAGGKKVVGLKHSSKALCDGYAMSAAGGR